MNFQSLAFGHIQTHFSTYRPTYLRLIFPVLVFALFATSETRHIVTGVLSDAFFQVAVFVAATLAVYHSVKHLSKHRLTHLKPLIKRYQIPSAAILGALPGCGGAIIVVTQFIRGQSNFGAIVAVLTATMGDAAFLLLATKPSDGLIIMALGVIVGTLSGYLVQRLHGKDFLMPSAAQIAHHIQCKPKQKSARMLWQWLLVPGLIIGLLMAFQLDVNQLLGLSEGTIEWIGALCAFVALSLWSLSSKGDSYQAIVSEDEKSEDSSWLNDVAHDTNFVLAWVIAAFLLFELLVVFTGINLGEWLSFVPILAPFIAVVIGLLPGCGPQIIVTSLYIEGHVPFSAQIGNAISNDGDALFPAIALAPKAALVATLYSAIPAIVVAYSYFFLFE